MAKGCTILLVVFGHIVARSDPAGVTWYEPIRHAIYGFHMPFFLYLSGFAASVSGALFVRPGGFPAYASARARRLLLPFFGLGGLIIAGKCAVTGFIFVDNAPSSPAAGALDLVWHTASSPVSSIWYLFVLFTVSVTAAFVLRGNPARVKLVFIFTLAAYALHLPAYLYLDRIGQFAVFFAAGAWAGSRADDWTARVDTAWPYCLAILIALLVLVALRGAHWPEKSMLLPLGLLSMPAIHGLVRALPPIFAPGFLWLGRYCFMIYLFNTLFIGLTKGILLHVLAWRAPDFTPFALALMAAGTLGPVALKHFAFRHVPRLNRLTD